MFARSFIPQFHDFSGFQGKRIGLTGQRGVLGGLLLERFQQAGIEAVPFVGDINDAAALETWAAGHHFDYFFHFAAMVPVPIVEGNPLMAYKTNAIGAFNVCEKVALAKPGCWFFLASSSHVYKPTPIGVTVTEDADVGPQTFYGVTKLAGEQLCEPILKKMNAPYCIGRIFSFTHAKQQEPYLVPSLVRKISALNDGDTLNVSNPSAVRDIQDASVIIDGVLHLATRRAQGVINIGSGKGMSVKEIGESVAASLGKRINITGVDVDAQGCLVADTQKLRAALTGDSP